MENKSQFLKKYQVKQHRPSLEKKSLIWETSGTWEFLPGASSFSSASVFSSPDPGTLCLYPSRVHAKAPPPRGGSSSDVTYSFLPSSRLLLGALQDPSRLAQYMTFLNPFNTLMVLLIWNLNVT